MTHQVYNMQTKQNQLCQRISNQANPCTRGYCLGGTWNAEVHFLLNYELEMTDSRKLISRQIHPACYLTALFPHIRSCSPIPLGFRFEPLRQVSDLVSYNLSVPKSHLITTEGYSKETLPHGTAVARLFPFSISLNDFSSLILMTACSFPICHLPPPELGEKSDTNSRAYSAL